MALDPGAPTPSFTTLLSARERIAPFIRRTPVLRDPELDAELGARIFFKCENLQLGGAFKLRGATHAALCLVEGGARPHLLTQSSGNHGAALALACRRLGLRLTVVVPRTAPQAKIGAMRALGAELVFCEPDQASRDQAVARRLAEGDFAYVHPFDDPRVIAGQGTATLEWLEEAPGLDAILVPVSGGGLASGTALAAHGIDPAIRIYGVEPRAAADAQASLRRGAIQRGMVGATVCDALRAELGALTFPILREHLADVLLVEDEEVLAAMRFAWERLKLVLEPSGAAALAALLTDPARFRGLRVGVMLTGGNVDPALFAHALGTSEDSS
jgi:threonine dehydratase